MPDIAKQLEDCTYCPKMCRHACPVSNALGRETFIPQAKMAQLNRLRQGHVAWSEENTEALWACTGCRECTMYCEHENEPGLVLLAARAKANGRGYPHPNLENYADRFRNRDERLAAKLRDHFPEETFAEDAMVGFWPGCDAIDKSMQDIEDALELFARVGAKDARLINADQACAGYPLIAAGYPDMFRWHAAKVAAELRRYRTVVINCSACLHTLRSQYPAEGVVLASEVLSLSEYLAQHVDELKPTAERKTVYYHDPCHLARYEGVIEPPRRVLGRVAKVLEFGWSKTDTECCGGSGLLPKTMPKTADSMAKNRLKHIANRGGGTVVTSCATCAFMLKSNAPERVEVLDLPSFLARELGEDSSDDDE